MSTGSDPVNVGPMPGDAPVTDQILIMLVGGPRNGHQERVPYGTTDVKVNVDGTEHDYGLGENLPDDFAQRIPSPHHPTKYFGYAGPDQQYIDALAAEYPPVEVDPPPGDGITRGPEHGPAYGARKDFPTRPSGTDPADRSPGAAERGPEHGPAYGEAKGKPAKPLTSEDFPR